MDPNFEPLDQDDVLLVDRGQFPSMQNKFIEKAGLLAESVNEALKSWPYVNLLTIPSGIPCTILRTTGGGWQKGKLRIKVIVEFQPDPVESGLEQHF